MTAQIDEPLALVIEDDDKLSLIFTEALRQAGFKTRVINDGSEALTILSTCQPALIMVDLHLPHVSGVFILEQIRYMKSLAQARIIITTADAVLAQAVRQPSDVVLIKPISVLQLRDLARQIYRAFVPPAD